MKQNKNQTYFEAYVELFDKIFTKNAWKWKKVDQEGGGPSAPLNPLMEIRFSFPSLFSSWLKLQSQIRKRLDQLHSKKVHIPRQQDWGVF